MKAEIKPRLNLTGRTPLQEVIPLKTPFNIIIDPASICNLKCVFCPAGDTSLVNSLGIYQGEIDFEIYKKIIDQLSLFPDRIKMLRLWKEGEPFLNKKLVEMVLYAKKSGYVDFIDTTTNGVLMTPDICEKLFDAGINRINISIYGINDRQYEKYTCCKIDFRLLHENIKWAYNNKKSTEIFIKIPENLITENEKKEFFGLFGDYCDRIFVENLFSSWNSFNVTEDLNFNSKKGIFQQDIQEKKNMSTYFLQYDD